MTPLRNVLAALCVALPAIAAQEPPPPRPNILWITCEDISPHLRCFGEPLANTPNLDRLAAEGVRYTRAFAPIGVCAPARSCLITGMYPTSLGTQHMRCQGLLPADVRCFTEYLRDAGYWCSNRRKTDYNFAPPAAAWDASDGDAHWRGRAAGQPFFSVFNLTVTHESRIRADDAGFARDTRRLTADQRHDPAQVSIPPYHPDVPEVRRDWARYHDLITAMDAQVGDRLRQLQDDGLADDTIVFFFADHGAGMPRSKRWLYDSSLRVPLIVRFPDRYRHLAPAAAGGVTDRLVSFVDFAPTVLGLAGIAAPAHLQGKAFLGADRAPPRRYVFGFRDRMDERYDLLRCVRDERFHYIRNFLPHRPYAQWIDYMMQMPTMRAWQRGAHNGTLRGPERAFLAERKPVEELYDTWADPHEVHDLAGDAEYADVLQRLRAALRAWMTDTIDLGLLPEPELRARFGERAPYDAVRGDAAAYPLASLLALASDVGRSPPPQARELLAAADPAVRWWTTVALHALGDGARAWTVPLRSLLDDPSGAVRVEAAATLCGCGGSDDALPVLAAALRDDDEWVRLAAANALDELDAAARPALAALRAATADTNAYVARVAKRALAAFE